MARHVGAVWECRADWELDEWERSVGHPAAWIVRAGRAGERDQWALREGLAGGGFREVESLEAADSRERVLELTAAAFAGEGESRIANYASQLWALRGRIQVGDHIVLPLKTTGTLAIGRVRRGYHYLPNAEPDRRHAIQVEWLLDDIPRSAVKQDLLYSLGAFMTVCEVRRNDAARRIAVLAETGIDPGASASISRPSASRDAAVAEEASDTEAEHLDIEQYSLDRLRSYVIETFAGHRMQDLVAAILTAEGFHCMVPPEGPDGGVDVLAGTGPLGLDQPRVVVQVKSEAGAVGAPVVSQLLGTLHAHDATQALLVAWGGVTKPAQQALSNQYFRVRVWTADDVLAGIFRTYARLPEELRAELLLKQVWTLVEEAG